MSDTTATHGTHETNLLNSLGTANLVAAFIVPIGHLAVIGPFDSIKLAVLAGIPLLASIACFVGALSHRK
jgi:hypothetical protein